MTNNIPCDIAKDLMPSYIDKLTTETTNRLMEAHLAGCADCKSTLEAMRATGDVPLIRGPEEKKEIDFLKKNRRRNRLVVLCSVLGALALLFAVLFIRFFVIGEAVYGMLNVHDIRVEGNRLFIKGTARSDANYMVKGFSEDERDGVVTFTVRGARRIFYGDDETLSFDAEYVYDRDIHTVRMDGRIIWHDGSRISAPASDVYETRHDYMGDMSANARTAGALNLEAYLGGYQNELLSESAPLTWKIRLAEEIPAENKAEKEQLMNAFGYVFLGVIGNLDAVVFEYECGGDALSRTVTAEDATAYFGRDIKGCMSSARLVDELLHRTGLNSLSYDQVLFGASPGIRFSLLNDTDAEIAYVGIGLYHDGALSSSGGAMNADNSALGKGQSLFFDLDAHVAGTPGEPELEFIIHTTDGKEYRVPERIAFPDTPGILHPLVLTGDAEGGFHVSQ